MTAATASRNGRPPAGAPHAHQRAIDYLAEHWPEQGGRNAAHGALAGGLLRDGLPVGEVEALVEALAERTEDNEAARRVARVAEAEARLRAGEPVTGWPKLAEMLGEDGAEVIARFRALLGTAITVERLAAHKALPVEFLRSLGLHDLNAGGVGVPYADAGGKPIAVKHRTKLSAGEGSYWPKGTPLIAYGEDHLEAAVNAGELTLVEGESDCWALWHHGVPALGLPGAETVHKTLHLGHVANVGTIYVHQEPDDSGARFVANVRHRLAALGWSGGLKVVRLETAKDPSDLHRAAPAAFLATWRKATEAAEPLAVGVPAQPVSPEQRPWPAPPGPEAFTGLPGGIVRAIGPASEADPAALLVQTLVAFGSAAGRGAHCLVEADRHGANEFMVVIGRTSKARKGTSWGRVAALFREADEGWATERVLGGASSGEGLIWAVRDPVTRLERVKERGEAPRYEPVEADPGVSDKRLLVLEPEFANVLKQTERQGNILSTTLRQAWDGGTLQSLVKNSPARATGAHISLIGHVTAEELRRYLTQTETANGFGNRHLFVCAERSKQLPEGGSVDPHAWAGLRVALAGALEHARTAGEVARDGEARALWREVYGPLSEGRPGLAGALLGRAEAHVLRLALIYALMDRSPAIRAEHLMAALALWDYCERSVYFVFGDDLGDPLADDLLRLLRNCPGGATRTDLSAYLGRNQTADRIGRALGLLLQHRLARCERELTGGRPAERWFAASRGA